MIPFITYLHCSLRHIEEEYESLKEEAPRLRTENEKYKKVFEQNDVALLFLFGYKYTNKICRWINILSGQFICILK